MSATRTTSQERPHRPGGGQLPFLLDRLRNAGFRLARREDPVSPNAPDAPGTERADSVRVFVQQQEYQLDRRQKSGVAVLSMDFDAVRGALMQILHDGLVHDLRSPLNSISINTEMLQTVLPESTDVPLDRNRVARYVGAIMEQVKALDATTSSLIGLLSGHDDAVDSIPLNLMLERTFATTAPTLRYWRVQPARSVDSDECSLDGNPEHVQLALTVFQVCAAGVACEGDRMTVTSTVDRPNHCAELTYATTASERGQPGETFRRVLEQLSARTEQSLLQALIAAIRIINQAGGHVVLSGGTAERIRVTVPTR